MGFATTAVFGEQSRPQMDFSLRRTFTSLTTLIMASKEAEMSDRLEVGQA